MSSDARYRPEVDGLRALAVLPVLFFHAGFPGFGGGFVGVDVFLVISGYLITRIILGDLGGRGFSYRRFYERRARRILPPLFAMLVLCVPLAFACLGPADFRRFAAGVVSVLAFGSNVHFWLESGYFAPDAESNALLHTWSLSLEEQFYFLFPALLAFTWARRREALLPVIVIGGVLSLALAQVGSTRFPGANFYLLPPRGWELLAGAALATTETHGRPRDVGPRLSAALALLGVALIAAAVAWFDESTPHPSLYTLVPVVGTALIIRFGHVAGPARVLLTARPVVAVGLISYSLYLWHQPLLVFGRLWLPVEPTLAQKGALLAASFGLAALSYRFVERPFRDARVTGLPTLVRALGAGAAALLLLAVGSRVTGGFPQRFTPDVLAAYESSGRDAARLFQEDRRKCHGRDPEDPCRLGAAGTEPTWALLGDSHASVLAEALHDELADRDIAGLHFGQSGCPFVPGFDVVGVEGSLHCDRTNTAITARISEPGIHTVVVAGRYAAYLHGRGIDNGLGGVDDERISLVPTAGVGGETRGNDEEARRRAVLEGYARSVDLLIGLGKRVILIYPVPEQGWDVPVKVAQRRVVGRDDRLGVPRALIEARMGAVDSTFDALSAHQRLIRIRVSDLFCEPGRAGECFAERAGRILYSDHDHLSLEGAELVMREVSGAIGRPRRADRASAIVAPR